MNHILKCHDIVKTDFIRAENCSVFDSQGREYIDFESGIWCTALGHNHPRINRAITNQLGQVMHLGTRYPNQVVEEAARMVLAITGIGTEGKCVFLSSGSEAVEFGASVIRRATGRSMLLSFANSYLAAFGSAGRKSPQDWFLVDWTSVDEDSTSSLLSSIPFESIAGFVFEPGGSGSGFVRFPPKELVQRIVEGVRLSGGLIMANEVTTGMGRTGKWFGFQHYAIQPDIVALGKGLGNGYPVSAVAMRSDLAAKIEASGLRYAQSHQNDPLGCAVAKEVITVMQAENLIDLGNDSGEYLLSELKSLADRYPVIKEVRGRGMLLGIELVPNPAFTAEIAYNALLERGFLVGFYPAGNVIRLDPALTISRGEIDRFLVAFTDVLEMVRQE